MKKIFLFCCMLPMLTLAQIAPVKTYDKPYEFIGNVVYHDKKTDTYYLHIQSDNQFEDAVFRYKIGKNGKEAATSLANLYAIFDNQDQLFDIGSYQFISKYGWSIRMIKSGDFYYKAGDYSITKYAVESAVKQLIADHNASCDEVNLIADDIQYGKLNVEYPCYHMNFSLDLKKNLLPFLGSRYAIGDTLSTEDAVALRKAAIEGSISSSLLKSLKDK